MTSETTTAIYNSIALGSTAVIGMSAMNVLGRMPKKRKKKKKKKKRR